MGVKNKSLYLVCGFVLVATLWMNVRQFPADQAELKHILHQVDHAKGRGYTQAEAQLSVPSVQQAMSGELNLARNKRIITEALHKEHALKDDYYVFYTAIPYMRLFQDVTRKLYKKEKSVMWVL